MSDLLFKSVGELTQLLSSRQISSQELTAETFARVDRANPSLNAVVTEDRDAAMARAREADELIAKGQSRGALHGLAITIKDAFEVAGLPATGGDPRLKGHIPSRHASVVGQVIDAGATVYGKTNVPLLSGDFQAYNEIYGTTNNPWDEAVTSGGSSGGAAAAVASGMSPFEIGSDIGGSIRTPAHFCGIFGHKPSQGLVSQRGHIPPAPGGSAEVPLMAVGPLARTAEDLHTLLKLVCHPCSRHSAWRLVLPDPRRRFPRGLRVALWPDDPFAEVDTEIAAAIEGAAIALEKRGAVIAAAARPEVSFADLFELYALGMYGIVSADFPEAVRARLIAEAKHLTPDDRTHAALLARGAALTYAQALALEQRRTRYRAAWAEFFKDIDVVLCPAAFTTAFPHDHRPVAERKLIVNGRERDYLDLLHWAGLATGCELPATVAPLGLSSAGLPIGVQIIGPFQEDLTPIMVAGMIERECGGFTPPPGYA